MRIILCTLLCVFVSTSFSSCTSSSGEPGTNAPFETTRWVLRSINDKKVLVPEGSTEPFIIFEKKDSRASGNAGCNGFFGTYSKSRKSLSFGPVARTEMYCEAMMEVENNLMKAFEAVSRYNIKGNTLSWYEGDKLLAKFEAVKMR